jgi:hypothetical protein
MDQDKARDFWKSVLDNASTLCAVLDAPPTQPELQADIKRIGRIVERLREAAAEIDPRLCVEVDQLPVHDGAMLRIAVSCNHDPEGIGAVQELVAAAPAMPPRIQICAFSQPLPREMAGELGTLDVLGQQVPIHEVRFLAEPSITAPGTFDIACFVPSSAVTDLDPQGVPGALLANIVLSMGLGELRLMTRVSSIGIAVTPRPPPEAVQAWDLVPIIDSAPLH